MPPELAGCEPNSAFMTRDCLATVCTRARHQCDSRSRSEGGIGSAMVPRSTRGVLRLVGVSYASARGDIGRTPAQMSSNSLRVRGKSIGMIVVERSFAMWSWRSTERQRLEGIRRNSRGVESSMGASTSCRISLRDEAHALASTTPRPRAAVIVSSAPNRARSSSFSVNLIPKIRGPPVHIQDHVRPGDGPCRRIRQPDVQDLAIANQVVDRSQDFIDKRLRRQPDPRDVDAVRIEPRKARLDLPDDGLATSARRRRGMAITQRLLGKIAGYHEVIAPSSHEPTNETFRRATAPVRRVDEVASCIDISLEDSLGLRPIVILICFYPEIVRAQRQLRDPESAASSKCPVVHRTVPSTSSPWQMRECREACDWPRRGRIERLACLAQRRSLQWGITDPETVHKGGDSVRRVVGDSGTSASVGTP